jgi:hypothetical protein
MSRHTLTFNSRNFLRRIGTQKTTREYQDRQVRIPTEGGHDSEIIPVTIPKLIRSRFRDEAGHGFRF